MKEKSTFSRIILIVILGFISIGTTIILAFIAGSSGIIINFQNLNYVNMLVVFLIGIFVSCFIVGIAILITAKPVIEEMVNYFKAEGDKK